MENYLQLKKIHLNGLKRSKMSTLIKVLLFRSLFEQQAIRCSLRRISSLMKDLDQIQLSVVKEKHCFHSATLQAQKMNLAYYPK